MSNCQQLIDYYTNKYITPYGRHVCNGPTSYPKTGIEFYNIIRNVTDHWDQNIACVMTGYKKVAQTDYDEFNPFSIEELKEYYKDRPKDIELRENAIKCGVQKLQDNRGTNFWFYPEYKRNAVILINHYNGIDRFPENLYSVTQALLLGYTDVSIICYELYHAMLNELFKIMQYTHEILENGEVYTYKTIDLNTPGSIPLIEKFYKDNLQVYINMYSIAIEEAKEWILQRGGKFMV